MRRALTTLAALAMLFVAVRVAPAQAGPEPTPPAPSQRPNGAPSIGGMLVLAGGLHDHTTDSDGDTASDVVAPWLLAHHQELGLDFLSFTEHSDFFPASYGRADAPVDPWGRSLAITRANSAPGFTMLRGFEHTNDQQNHLNVIESSNWLARKDEITMDVFYGWLAATPTADPTGRGLGFGGGDGVGQFNHPSSKGPLNWDDYRFDAAAAEKMATIEVREGAAGWYWFALSKGWTLGPVQNLDYHNWTADKALGAGSPAQPGLACRETGGKTYLGCARSLVIATDNSRPAIMEALRGRRTTASERPDLWATLRGPGQRWQGSTVTAAPGTTIELTVDAGGGSAPLRKVEIIRDGTATDQTTFYGPNDPIDKCFPTPDDPTNNCGQHAPGFLEQERRYQLSAGQATRKGPHDGTPAGTIALSADVDGVELSRTFQLQVPTSTSTRPDGKHFFYAIVTRTDGTRAITAPIFTAG
jgi:hypothetical protein